MTLCYLSSSAVQCNLVTQIAYTFNGYIYLIVWIVSSSACWDLRRIHHSSKCRIQYWLTFWSWWYDDTWGSGSMKNNTEPDDDTNNHSRQHVPILWQDHSSYAKNKPYNAEWNPPIVRNPGESSLGTSTFIRPWVQKSFCMNTIECEIWRYYKILRSTAPRWFANRHDLNAAGKRI